MYKNKWPAKFSRSIHFFSFQNPKQQRSQKCHPYQATKKKKKKKSPLSNKPFQPLMCAT